MCIKVIASQRWDVFLGTVYFEMICQMFSMQQLILYNLVYRIWGNLIVVLIM